MAPRTLKPYIATCGNCPHAVEPVQMPGQEWDGATKLCRIGPPQILTIMVGNGQGRMVPQFISADPTVGVNDVRGCHPKRSGKIIMAA